jgi:hypothetical protein
MNEIFNIIFTKHILLSYDCLKLRKVNTSVKVTLKTQNFQQYGSHVTHIYNLKFFKTVWKHKCSFIAQVVKSSKLKPNFTV